ncbi:glycosyltransferase [Actinocrinis puniceicyclus]|uniref:Glycosyltransferase n=1 Tax=Actinocrinis puniceicyclus TaxID=977794 RepID=A0A8J7WP37_9ACTN|nr:glycosyltransferase [Actinocrinis puniceicyclus]MBS2963389.1 glycosyltransferase [Actinocrinis puniceicyclus]
MSGTAARPRRAVIVVLNLPVPDDHRVWAQALALRDDGVAVTVVCPAIRDKTPGRARIDGVDVVYFRSFEGAGRLGTIVEGAWTTLVSTRAAKRALRRPSSARTLQVCNPPDMLFGLLRWARRRGCRTVYDQHDVVPALAGSRPAFRKLEPFFLACERRTVAAADAVLTPSTQQAQRLRRLYGREAVVVRTASVVAGAAGAAGGRERDEADGCVLGYLGVIGEQDGVCDLIEAVDVLRGRGLTGFRVEVAGDGPALAAVREQVTRRGLDDLVRLRGWLGPGQLVPFLDGIDAMTVPDPDVEFNHYCAMNKVTHAMARGIPVVLRPLRENAMLVADSGVVAKDMSLPAFADALEAVVRMPEKERAEVGERLREIFAAQLSWEASARRYLEAVSPAA